jgi:hypothetical protein
LGVSRPLARQPRLLAGSRRRSAPRKGKAQPGRRRARTAPRRQRARQVRPLVRQAAGAKPAQGAKPPPAPGRRQPKPEPEVAMEPCAKCGKPFAADATVCPHCGVEYDLQPDQTGAAPAAAEKVPGPDAPADGEWTPEGEAGDANDDWAPGW